MIIVLLSTLALQAQTPRTASARSSTPIDTQAKLARFATAYSLAQEVRDQASTLAQMAKVFEDGTIKQMSANPDLSAAETAFPGLLKHMFTAARPELERQIVATLPDLWRRIANVLAQAMDDGEIATTDAYYRSSAGRRFKAAMVANYKIDREIAPIVADVNAKVSVNAVKQGIVETVPGALAELSESDKEALMAFSRTRAFQKMQAITPKLLEAAVEWGSADLPEPAKIDAVMTAAAQQFIASRTTKKQNP